jgi:Protein FAM135
MQTFMGPKKTQENLFDQSRLPVMPVFSEDDSPRSTTQQSFLEQINSENTPSRTRLSRSRSANAVARAAQSIPHTPPRIFSNHLNEYNKSLPDESPKLFNSRQIVPGELTK